MQIRYNLSFLYLLLCVEMKLFSLVLKIFFMLYLILINRMTSESTKPIMDIVLELIIINLLHRKHF